MQTFLPYPSFIESAKVLDKKRCWKQVVETKQILKCLYGLTDGWKNHPAIKMWVGYENALCVYFNHFLIQSIGCHNINTEMKLIDIVAPVKLPKWFGNESFHQSHRSNLLRKNAEFYGRFGWKEPDNLPYVWPT